MSARLSIGVNIRTNTRAITDAFAQLKLRVPLALADATAGGPRFQEWFCPAGTWAGVRQRVQPKVVTLLDAMNVFLNGNSMYNLTVVGSRDDSPNAETYGYVYPDLGRMPQAASAGSQFFIYLGNHWNGVLAVANPPPPGHARQTPVQVLAHELSHHFGTNSRAIDGGLYAAEHYDADALRLPDNSAIYAAHNADNYGYYIEEF